jgi:hypothetical protein
LLSISQKLLKKISNRTISETNFDTSETNSNNNMDSSPEIPSKLTK